jgi:hypothetical protein
MSGWNGAAPERWRRLHSAAAQEAKRQTGQRPRLVAWAWEFQKRGALHKHFVLGMGSPGERAAARVYMCELERLRGSHGYGFISDTRQGRLARAWREIGPERIEARRAGNYVAKYLALKGSDGRPVVAETVAHPDVPPLVVYVDRRLTGQTGVTMRSLRFQRFAWRARFDYRTGETFASAVSNPVHPELGLPPAIAAMIGPRGP